MPVLTRSKTIYGDAYNAALERGKALTVAANAEEDIPRKCVIINEFLVFTLRNRYMNQLLKTNEKFRKTVYSQCNEFLASDNCTYALARTCRALLQKISM